AGRNQYRFFTRAMQNAAQESLRLIHDLQRALGTQDLQVHYQPIVELATGRTTKAEALLRWNHPVDGPVCPADFISCA
ncbi:MAG: diguanylate cyclase, partial [Nitrospiraceae bacterium]